MDGKKSAAVALIADGEEPVELRSESHGSPGLMIGRGSQSSPFLRHRLSDPSISREHVKVEAVASTTGQRVQEGASSVRVTVLGANPIVLTRRQAWPAHALLYRGETSVAEAGDSFTFCRGFDEDIRIIKSDEAAVPQNMRGEEMDATNGKDGDRCGKGVDACGADIERVFSREPGELCLSGQSGGDCADRNTRDGTENAAVIGGSQRTTDSAVTSGQLATIKTIRDFPEGIACDDDRKSADERGCRHPTSPATGALPIAAAIAAEGTAGGASVAAATQPAASATSLLEMGTEDGGHPNFKTQAWWKTSGGDVTKTAATVMSNEAALSVGQEIVTINQEPDALEGLGASEGVAARGLQCTQAGSTQGREGLEQQKEADERQREDTKVTPDAEDGVGAETGRDQIDHERGGYQGADQGTQAETADSDSLVGLKMALVRRGLSAQLLKIFRKRGAELGMDIRLLPTVKVRKSPSLWDIMPSAPCVPGVATRRCHSLPIDLQTRKRSDRSTDRGSAKDNSHSCDSGGVGSAERKGRRSGGGKKRRRSGGGGEKATSTDKWERPLPSAPSRAPRTGNDEPFSFAHVAAGSRSGAGCKGSDGKDTAGLPSSSPSSSSSAAAAAAVWSVPTTSLPRVRRRANVSVPLGIERLERLQAGYAGKNHVTGSSLQGSEGGSSASTTTMSTQSFSSFSSSFNSLGMSSSSSSSSSSRNVSITVPRASTASPHDDRDHSAVGGDRKRTRHRHDDHGEDIVSRKWNKHAQETKDVGHNNADNPRTDAGTLEDLCRQGFICAVCSSTMSRRALWDELGLRSTVPGGGVSVEGRSIEVVGQEWLSSCLRQERRVPLDAYLVLPPREAEGSTRGLNGLNAGGDGHRRGHSEGEELLMLDVNKYACQRPTPMRHHNEMVTGVLDAMVHMYKVIGDGTRADSYQRASSVLRSLPRRIQSANEVAHAHHVGPGLLKNIDEILATGTLQRLEELRQNPMNLACLELSKVHGVGPKTAVAWYKSGVRTVQDAVRRLGDNPDGESELPLLKEETIMGLKNFDDLQVPINRDEVLGIAKEVREEAERYGRERDPQGTVLFEVCGGFRRGKETFHDVDMLVSFRRRNGKSGHEKFVEGMRERLEGTGKLCDTLFQGYIGGYSRKHRDIPPIMEREEVLMGLWQLPDRKCRIDIVQVALPQWPFAVLGWSGTVMFEKELRRYANEQMGLRLSQKGLSIQDSEVPLPDVFRTEEDIFRRLGLEYIPPHLRWA